MGVPAHPKRENPTPTPPHMGSSDSESTIKDENGQDITCVVCGDKSSGKHYGQFTCEGNVYAICLHCLDNLLTIYVICKPFICSTKISNAYYCIAILINQVILCL